MKKFKVNGECFCEGGTYEARSPMEAMYKHLKDEKNISLECFMEPIFSGNVKLTTIIDGITV